MNLQILRIAAVGAACWAAACSRPVTLPVHQLDVPAPLAWSDADADPAQPDPNWWSYFESPGLDGVIRKALNCNRSLAAAAARVEAAEQERIASGSERLPQLNLGANRLRQRQNFVGLPFPGLADRVLSNTFSSAGLAFNVSWEADLWNRLSARELEAEAGLAAREADLQAARLSLSGQAAKAWFAATEARRQVQLAAELVRHLETVERWTRERHRHGSRSPLDVRAAEADVMRARAIGHQRQQALDAAVRQVEILACEYPAGSRRPEEALPAVPASAPAGLPSDLVRRRPDLLAAERALLAADARIVQSRAALLPSFSLTSSAGTSSNALLDLVNPSLQVWNYALGAALPLFQRGRLKAALKASEARSREAEAAYGNLAWNAFREVETALAAERTLRDQQAQLRLAHRLTEGSIAFANDRYRVGSGDIFSVLSLRRAVLESESALLSLHRSRADNRVDLHLALGGGFPPAAGDPAPAARTP